jgi:hypothetical protein
MTIVNPSVVDRHPEPGTISVVVLSLGQYTLSEIEQIDACDSAQLLALPAKN